ncbi:MAG: diacylglycerol kinase family lipid kinase [Deltaproteobacteria bacterium]|nr:diacylglycerol kinase family lipid kinase [Deltaproteobacteria bacterium]
MKIRFIINPAAGGADRVRRIEEAVGMVFGDDDGIFEVRSTRARGHAGELAADAVKKGYEFVFACGGDGTINETATPLVGTGTVLGIIPGGSGNGFAKALGLPEDIEAAMRLVKTGSPRPIDVGVICNRYFFSTAGCGFDAHLSKSYNSGGISTIMRGMLPYYPLALWEYIRYRPAPVTVNISNFRSTVTPFLLTAANTSRYGAGAIIAPDAIPDDGMLDLCIVPKTGFFSALSLASKLLSGRVTEFKGFESIRAEKIEIQKGAGAVHADGEPFDWSGDIEISVMRRMINVLAV